MSGCLIYDKRGLAFPYNNGMSMSVYKGRQLKKRVGGQKERLFSHYDQYSQ